MAETINHAFTWRQAGMICASSHGQGCWGCTLTRQDTEKDRAAARGTGGGVRQRIGGIWDLGPGAAIRRPARGPSRRWPRRRARRRRRNRPVPGPPCPPPVVPPGEADRVNEVGRGAAVASLSGALSLGLHGTGGPQHRLRHDLDGLGLGDAAHDAGASQGVDEGAHQGGGGARQTDEGGEVLPPPGPRCDRWSP